MDILAKQLGHSSTLGKLEQARRKRGGAGRAQAPTIILRTMVLRHKINYMYCSLLF